ncbi:MFS transporter [Paraburkholderia tropica]|uniref:MFS transporter, putative metabolite:H+ symporter n=1 Tax=Paraburkholderia tropica TaxID=92647 RepID=A0AAQ1JW53_9BURK|nr:MFS transporter [Paraburkholderia tropica]QNB14923.1 MFS transporter [Paraburkholderia tropica]RQN34983.1 MFS transporter [Paraburkholderia tropica]SEK03163.1 MFS transporter, putative metabolite:H+ symporter [Paraburkholderia tropica]
MELTRLANEYETIDDARVAGRHEAALISARIERLPFTRWHTRVLGMIGLVHMTDAFDALTIAFVMPVLMGLWHLTPTEAGLLVSSGYVGQTIGALLFSAAAERFGRLRVLRWLLVLLALGSVASAYAPGYAVFIALRLFQGIGLGGESPVSATYMNEVCPARIRGRVIFVLQSTFALGNLVAAIAALWLIPAYGWQIMFLVGGLPIVLAAILPRVAPESPRWLAINGRADAARRIVDEMERTAPAARLADASTPEVVAHGTQEQKESFRALFARGFARRTLVVWLMAGCGSLTTYGILVWLPSLYRTVYHLPLEVALRYGMVSMIATLLGTFIGTFAIDWLGRRKTFAIAFLGAALPMCWLALSGTRVPAGQVLVLASMSVAMIAIVQCGIYVYAPEVYPTRIRATGAGAASAITRIASVIGPLVIGTLLTYLRVEAVFGYFALVSLLGAIVIGAFAIETRGRKLDEIAA